MRVLHCIPTMEGGGAEKQLALLVKGQVALGVLVFVVLRRGGENLEILLKSGATIIYISATNVYSPIALLELIRLIKKERIDIVQTWLPQMDILGGIASLFTRVPFVLSERSCKQAYPQTLKHIFRKIIGRFSTGIIANSNAGFDYWKPIINKKFNKVIKNIINHNINYVRKEENRIIYAGRYIKSKNIINLLFALKKAQSRFPDIVVDLYGEGPEKESLKKLCKSLNIDNFVHINSYTKHLLEQLERSLVFVNLSLFEGHPNSVVEAASCGCALLLSDIQAHREFLDDSSAYFVNQDSIQDISDKLISILSHPNMALKKGLLAQLTVLNWTPYNISQQYINVYNLILRS